MVMFLAHIAFMLEVMGLSAGFVALFYANRLHSKLIKAAGILLVVFGTSGIVCTGYYSLTYFMHGHFEHAYDDGIPRDASGGKHYEGSPPGD